MKILISTIHRGFNMGSALQTYALSEILKNLGHVPVILDYIPNRMNLREKIVHHIKIIFSFKSSFNDRYLSVRGIAILMSNNIVYHRFFKKHINLTKSYYTYEEILHDTAIKYYDAYMTGSDQVWNSIHNRGIDFVYFLGFAPGNKPRVAYASSFGKNELDHEEATIIEKFLSRYRAVSVREKSAVKILNSIGIDGVNVLDPTLLLNKDDWTKRMPKIKIKNKFLLIYSVEPNKIKLIEYAVQIAKLLNLKIYMVEWGVKKYPKVDKMINFISPLCVLSYFVDACYIVASSFHGTALAINFNKQFISIQPEKFNTRVVSILEITGLTDRLMDEHSFSIEKATEIIDYSNVNCILAKERGKSISFIENSLHE